jgi:hypothetical protein
MESPEYLDKLSAAQSSGISVEVTDLETGISTVYHAIRFAAKALGIDKRYIEHYIYLEQDTPVLGRYTFKLLNTEEGKNSSILPDLSDFKRVQKTSKKVEVTNVKTQEVIVYPSIGAAARALGFRQPSISLYLKENRVKPFKGLYLFKLV